jgi:hypothetical protein
MDTQIVAVYCLCDDLLKALYHAEDPQCQMSDAEVMTADLFWALFNMLGETWKQLNEDSLYIVDSFPVAVCDNYRFSSKRQTRQS